MSSLMIIILIAGGAILSVIGSAIAFASYKPPVRDRTNEPLSYVLSEVLAQARLQPADIAYHIETRRGDTVLVTKSGLITNARSPIWVYVPYDDIDHVEIRVTYPKNKPDHPRPHRGVVIHAKDRHSTRLMFLKGSPDAPPITTDAIDEYIATDNGCVAIPNLQQQDYFARLTSVLKHYNVNLKTVTVYAE